MDQDELMLRLIEKEIDLYTFYLGVTISLSVFVFGTTGAILAFQLNRSLDSIIGYSLLVPVFLNIGFSCICRKGVRIANNLAEGHSKRIEMLKDSKEFYLREAIGVYDFSALPETLDLLSNLYLCTAIGVLLRFVLWRAQVH